MLFFYIICGCLIFALSGFVFHINRLAIYRRRIIRHFSKQTDYSPFMLTKGQEAHIKQCFFKGDSVQSCIDTLAEQVNHKNKSD
ncbi:hypothetical protein ACLKMH_18555 [Psychromonas sp. KJ10-10]|uniref:hypothetical protein n=1 Tax=Psychromonas sp. KJ10-10 TaxID=3391823 RepID=UPI0039B3CA13